MTLRPIILAGGGGTRLWPLSREGYPKQFLRLVSKLTMLQDTVGRLDGMDDVLAPVVLCNEVHRFLVTEQLREVDHRAEFIILEPAARNTAPALTLAAIALSAPAAGGDADPVLLVMPADHVVKDVSAFRLAVREGVGLADGGDLVTFGVVPTSPETGYGYIRKGEKLGSTSRSALVVDAFVEKPDQSTAVSYLRSDDYLWNSGMFMMRASVWLREVSLYRPDIASVCRAAHHGWRHDGDFRRPDEQAFSECPSDSIDYAVMEKAAGADAREDQDGPPTTRCVVVPMEAGWSDVGTWSVLWSEGTRDSKGNVTRGDVYADSSRNNLLIAENRFVAALGVEDLTVIETADAVLVAGKDRGQDVRKIVEKLKADKRPEHATHLKVHRPWGSYELLQTGPGFQVKRLTVRPGASLSLQLHGKRSEHWIVVRGTAAVTRGDESFQLTENESTFIPVGARHRLGNPGPIDLEVVEVQVGAYLGEDDIERFEDDYNRHHDG